MVQLKKGAHTVSIDAGELVGYTVNGHEFMHQKGSAGWSSTDTEMFPIIGPVNEAGFRVQVTKGSALQDQHGLLRQFPYVLVSRSSQGAVYKKEYTASTLIKNSKFPKNSPKQWLVWPYSFTFIKQFALTDKGLEITFMVDGEHDMPFMLGYHPSFKLYSKNPVIKTAEKAISLNEVLAVGSRALEIADCDTITLADEKQLVIKTEGFGHFMCWTEVRNMVCIEPITFYPYAVGQQNLHEGFQYLRGKALFKVELMPEA